MVETASTGLWFIDDDDALDELGARLADADFVPIDTEFERRRTYFAELCLVQVAAGNCFACIDTIATGSVEPLVAALCRPGTVTVLHSARQDLEVLFQAAGRLPGAVFDTQIAAALAGFSDQIGYADLVRELLGVTLEKTQTRTDWRTRPLSAAQLEYAVDDVRYLEPVRRALEARLEALGRSAWLVEDCAALLLPALYAPEPREAWQRIKGLGRLDDAAFARAAGLAAWREQQARAADLPRMWILKDQALIALAAAAPRDRSELEGAAELARGTLRRYAEEMLAILRAPPPAPPRSEPRAPGEAQRAASKALTARVREIATELDIPPSVLLTRREIDQIAGGRVPARVAHGWRASLLADAIAALVPRAAGAD